MSKKLNSFENYFIKSAIQEAVARAEQDILFAESNNKRPIFATGYFDMIGKDMLEKIDTLTLKSALKLNNE